MNGTWGRDSSAPLFLMAWGLVAYIILLGIGAGWWLSQIRDSEQRRRQEVLAALPELLKTETSGRLVSIAEFHVDRKLTSVINGVGSYPTSGLVKAFWQLSTDSLTLSYATARARGSVSLPHGASYQDRLAGFFQGLDLAGTASDPKSATDSVAASATGIPWPAPLAPWELLCTHPGSDFLFRKENYVWREIPASAGTMLHEAQGASRSFNSHTINAKEYLGWRGLIIDRAKGEEVFRQGLQGLADKLDLEFDLFDDQGQPVTSVSGGSQLAPDERAPFPRSIIPLDNNYYVRSFESGYRRQLLRRPWQILVFGMSLLVAGMGVGTLVILRRRTRQTQEMLQLRNYWIANLAHVLRGPVHALGVLREAFCHAASTEERERIGQQLACEVDLLDSTCRRFLRLAQAGRTGVCEPPTAVAPLPLLREIACRLIFRHAHIQEGDLTFSGSATIRAWISEEALAEVAETILDNAMKYTTRRPALSVQVFPSADGCRIEVTDNGLGIPAEVLRELGQPFCRGGQAGTDGIKGTGIGLYLARTIVIAAGGKLEISSPGSDNGTTVAITLPAPPIEVACSEVDPGGMH